MRRPRVVLADDPDCSGKPSRNCFPRYYAAATLDHEGTTRYFTSEETRREFAKRHGMAP